MSADEQAKKNPSERPNEGFAEKSIMEGKDVCLDSAQLLVEVGVRLWDRIAPY
jgi:hypothetical protein